MLSLTHRLRTTPYLIAECEGVTIVKPLQFFVPLTDQFDRPHFRHTFQPETFRSPGGELSKSAAANCFGPLSHGESNAAAQQ